MTKRMRFSFGNITLSVILSTYPIGLIVPMTGPSHRANLIPSTEGSPRCAANQRKKSARMGKKRKKKADEAEAGLRGGCSVLKC